MGGITGAPPTSPLPPANATSGSVVVSVVIKVAAAAAALNASDAATIESAILALDEASSSGSLRALKVVLCGAARLLSGRGRQAEQ